MHTTTLVSISNTKHDEEWTPIEENDLEWIPPPPPPPPPPKPLEPTPIQEQEPHNPKTPTRGLITLTEKGIRNSYMYYIQVYDEIWVYDNVGPSALYIWGTV